MEGLLFFPTHCHPPCPRLCILMGAVSLGCSAGTGMCKSHLMQLCCPAR